MHTCGVEKGWRTSSSENNQKRHFEKKRNKSYLLRVISEKPKFPGVFAPGKLTAIEIHTP